MTDGEKYYTTKEIAEMFKVAYLTVYRWIKEGRIEAYKLGKEYRIKKTDIDKFMESSKYHTKNKK